MELIYLFFAFLSAFFAALVAIFGKIGLQGMDSNAATAVRAVIMALFLIGVVFFQQKASLLKSIFESNAFVFIVLSGIAGALSWLFYFLALQGATVSQVVPIDRLSLVFAVLLAVVFLGEKISLNTAIGVLLVLVGGIIVAFG